MVTKRQEKFRRLYKEPVLKVYGNLEDITRAGSGGNRTENAMKTH